VVARSWAASNASEWDLPRRWSSAWMHLEVNSGGAWEAEEIAEGSRPWTRRRYTKVPAAVSLPEGEHISA
jgi:hypothetical protein